MISSEKVCLRLVCKAVEARIEHLLKLFTFHQCTILNFQTSFFKNIWHFHIFDQIQLKVYMRTLNVVKLSGMKFHVAMQP